MQVSGPGNIVKTNTAHNKYDIDIYNIFIIAILKPAKNTAELSWPIKPHNFGHVYASFSHRIKAVFYLVQDTCTRKQLVQERMTHAQKASPSFWY